MSFKESELYDGGLGKDGIFCFVFCCITLLFTATPVRLSVLSIIIFVAASIISIVWCANSYKLQLPVERLVVPLFCIVGLFYSFGFPVSSDPELSFTTSIADGQFFSRFLYLPFYLFLRLFSSPIVSAYIARVMTILVCAVILGFSIQTIPYGETIIAVIALLPSSILQVIQGSSVATSLFLSILFVSLTIRVAYTKSFYTMTTRYRFALLFAASIMALSDLACLSFLTLLFMIPSRCYGDKKNRLRFVSILVVIILVILVYRFYTTGNYSSSVFSKKDVFEKEIISRPISYLATLFRTFFNNGGMYILNIVSPEMTHKTIPWPFVMAFMVTFIYTLYFDSGLSPKRYFVIRCTLLTTFLFTVIIATKAYLFNSTFDLGLIDNLLGPEFLPALLPAIFFIKRLFKHPAAPQKNLSFAVLICVLVNLATVVYYL